MFTLKQKYTSPHQRLRSPGACVDLIVVHAISLPSGVFWPEDEPWEGSPVHALFMGQPHPLLSQIFTTKAPQVSAHYVIRRTGDLFEYVSPDHVAFHAGISSFQGRESCNAYSIGVEFEGDWETGGRFTNMQYEAFEALVAQLCLSYPIRWLTGHAQVALPRGRKKDPGAGFDWLRVHAAFPDLLAEAVVS